MLPDTLVSPVTQQINAYSFTSPTTSLLSSANTSGCMNDPYYSMYSELYHPTEHRTFVVPATGAVLLPPPSPPLAAPVSVFPIVPQVPPLPHNSDFLQSSAISNNINTFPMQQRSSLEDARMFHTTLPPPPTTTTAFEALVAKPCYNTIDVQDLFVLEITPFSLGIEDVNGDLCIIITRNQTIPLRTKFYPIFTNAYAYQTTATIRVFRGEHKLTKYNVNLIEIDSLNKSDIDQYLASVESDSDCRALRVDDRRPNNNSLYTVCKI
ncbi:unnamed protein product [Rotaria sp. Silwood1]|nr:unnamed protein product [Rotaria sp. Silwood1]